MAIVILIVNLNFVVDDNLDYVIDFYNKTINLSKTILKR